MDIKVLIVEDEAIVALDLKSTLLKLGFKVTNVVTKYKDAIKSVQLDTPSIILMDINLNSEKDGIDIATDIKKSMNIPIIFLTAFSDDETISRAIKTDPVGYLIKPFNTEELKSTIMLGFYKFNNNISEDRESNLIRLSSDYFYSKEPHLKIYYKQKEITLTQKERMLMEILIQANGQIVSFSSIEHYIWYDKVVSDSTLRTLIYRLRTKLDYKVIETLPTIGCKLIL